MMMGLRLPGFTRSRRRLGALGEVWIVAPDRERTAVGHAVTLHKPLRITKMAPRVFMVNGTPVDCVNLGSGEGIAGAAGVDRVGDQSRASILAMT